MVKTISLAAAIGLALLGLVLSGWDSLPETSVLGRLSAIAEQMSVRDRLEREVGKATGSVVQAPDLARPALSIPLQTRPVPRPQDIARRPVLRPFAAMGPLVARLSDPAFGSPVRPADLLVPDPPQRLAGAGDLLCIAVAIYHEARDQPLDGQLAVASVILNRMREPERWGRTACAVVVPGQFSFLSVDGSYPAIRDRQAWEIALEMAREALERGPSSLVGRADHYHTPAVDPEWNQDMRQVIRIDDHIFFLDPATQG